MNDAPDNASAPLTTPHSDERIPFPGDAGAASNSMDGYSIASLVAAATCCAGPVAVVLGIIGLRRTRDRQRPGRWAAVTGLAVGLVGSLLMVPVVAGLSYFVGSFFDDLDPARAEPGQCIDFDFFEWPNEVPCSGPHAGEIIWAGKVSAALEEEWQESKYADDFCRDRPMSREHARALETDDSLRVDYWNDGWDWDPSVGEWMLCYLKASDGDLQSSVSARPA